MEKSVKRAGIVAILGTPNAGKSTLLNCLIGQKLSIVSPKAQTTRSKVKAIEIYGNTQIVFIDTPGIFETTGKLNTRLNRSIVLTAKNALEGVDYAVLIIDSSKKPGENEEALIEYVSSLNNKKILILNKVDKADKERLLKLSAQLNEKIKFESTFMISALKNKGVKDFTNYLKSRMPEGEWLYPEDQLTDMPMRVFAAEITREKLFLKLDKEIPYKLLVETEKYEESEKNIKIYQTIYVVSESHKKIILGKSGENLKATGTRVRDELSQITSKKVSVFLFVKVRKNWEEKKEHYLYSGIDYAK
jgi:GTP-binding protein Era